VKSSGEAELRSYRLRLGKMVFILHSLDRRPRLKCGEKRLKPDAGFVAAPTIRLKALFVLLVLVHHRRKVAHLHVAEPPGAQSDGQQIVEASPWATAPNHLLRGGDIYGDECPPERVPGNACRSIDLPCPHRAGC
jgi:hypothetical protein